MLEEFWGKFKEKGIQITKIKKGMYWGEERVRGGVMQILKNAKSREDWNDPCVIN